MCEFRDGNGGIGGNQSHDFLRSFHRSIHRRFNPGFFGDRGYGTGGGTREGEVLATGPIDLCLYNAGVDCHENDPGGGLAAMNSELLGRCEELVFSWAKKNRVPIAFVLAGGYVGEGHPQEAVVAVHRQTVVAALAAAD